MRTDIRKRFADRSVTTWQIALFGLTGGLIPCPAAVTVLLLCMQLKQFSLGFALALCFGMGLAITMVSAGVLAALSMRQIERRWTGFSRFARQAPDRTLGPLSMTHAARSNGRRDANHFCRASGFVRARTASMKSSVVRLRDRFFSVMIATSSRVLGNSTGKILSDGCMRGSMTQ